MRKGQKHSEETKQKMREKSRQRWSDPKKLEKLKEQSHEYWSNPDARKKQSEKRSEYCKNNPDLIKKSLETRERISKSAKMRYSNEEERVKASIKRKEYLKKHPELSENMSLKMKEWHRNHPERAHELSIMFKEHNPLKNSVNLYKMISSVKKHRRDHPEFGNKISRKLKDWYSTHPVSPKVGIGHGSYFTKDDGTKVWLRSSFEIRYATILSKMKVKWEYEKSVFKIDSIDTSYRPDFYIPVIDLYVEVKGYMRPKKEQIMIEFHKQYPDIKLIIVYNDRYNGFHIDDMEKEHNDMCEHVDICKFGINIKDFVELKTKETRDQNL